MVITDPLDGREKLVLSNYAMGETGSILFIDTESGEGESIKLPKGPGAWGLVNWHNEKLVVGTCVDQAYLHVLDLRARKWSETLEPQGEAYFWGMTLGSDGKVYGGTYPGCSLLQYDPVNHTLNNLGKVSANTGNQYSRPVWGEAPGYILVNYGFDTCGMKAYRIESGEFVDFGAPGSQIKWVTSELICAENGDNGRLIYYDAATLQPLTETIPAQLIPRLTVTLPNGQSIPVRQLADNRLAGVRGQEYFIVATPEHHSEGNEDTVVVVLKPIPVEAPPTAIFTLQSDGKELLWGSSGFGQTIFSFDPVGGTFWNSPSVCDAGGEVYGVQFIRDCLFLSSYVGGDHVVYDPAKPWDQLNNLNPQTLRSVGPELIRPEGRSVIGPDGGFWTGWSAKYGVYGGGLSRVDPVTFEVECWLDPVPQQQIAGVASDDKFIYFTTNGGASGLPHRAVPCRFGIWAPGKGLVHEEIFPEEQEAGNAIVALGGKVACGVGARICIFDRESRSFIHTASVENSCQWLVAIDSQTAGAFCGDQYWEVDVDTGVSRFVCTLPGFVRAAVIHSGKLYFAVNADLYVFHRLIPKR
ncbi:hypothetical protein ACFQ3W_00950 [Paenibacillus puldeungensis]|uniref:Uncharacterized protein n=2 Tax=Paenibacillus puldeungensis TaxID=696536 RepID=A0ABW3RQW8_9BACL